MNKNIFFFLGTEAELIKVFPVILDSMKKGGICHIIASGQNDLTKSRIMKEIPLNGMFLELSRESDIKKSAKGLLAWFIKTYRSASEKIEEKFGKGVFKGAPMVVHGDTVSTLMGARIGKKLGCVVCHVEAGLRSHPLFNPFPEEIDRLLTSRFARVHFAPGAEPVKNLRRAKGRVVDTVYNTILDSLKYSKDMPVLTKGLQDILKQDYFVFVMHRQENLANKEFVRQVMDRVEKFAQKRRCVLILHKITEVTFADMGILKGLQADKHFVLLPRVDYFDFMKLLDGAQYVITDGGSNQEELHYMGKPCLIMRKATERQEGIGRNAVLYGGDIDAMEVFEENHASYRIESLLEDYSPSGVIADALRHMKSAEADMGYKNGK